ncbi:hypothetical protein [Streptomyces sp. NRRL B-1347]|uniref:hypothetical protein n=1 Tax=Streptomyces sp. NRRL B-1347 TaxID=1476877 RepID=UPI00068C88E9|nr:hypothetical protein [Streptomyces sp. NRRL B-1347]
MTAAGSGLRHERAALDAVRLRRVNRWQAETLREDLADLYVESSDATTGETYRRREDFLHRLADSVRRPGFSMLLAETATPAGCAYGFPLAREGTWWLGFEGDLPQSIEQLPPSGHAFTITETVTSLSDSCLAAPIVDALNRISALITVPVSIHDRRQQRVGHYPRKHIAAPTDAAARVELLNGAHSLWYEYVCLRLHQGWSTWRMPWWPCLIPSAGRSVPNWS